MLISVLLDKAHFTRRGAEMNTVSRPLLNNDKVVPLRPLLAVSHSKQILRVT